MKNKTKLPVYFSSEVVKGSFICLLFFVSNLTHFS